MSTQLTIYSVSIQNAQFWVRHPAPGSVEETRRRAEAVDAQGEVDASRTMVEAVDDIFGDRPKHPEGGDAYARVWQDVIEYGESTRFDFGPLRRGARYLAEASEEFQGAGVPRELTPMGFMYDNPFTDTPQARNAPIIGHVKADQVPPMREAYAAIVDQVEAADLVKVLLAAVDETLNFNAFARDFPEGPLPLQDLVTFYG
ncbi:MULTISPECIES: DUF7691 family protein [Actinomadura]|uniref:DUF7691 domain-containing protein n=1 Tax=Actinomadura yumaensis TaxID=111807 RepID=A0ABW2CI11_9ACTN|nr:hypothetical protein [Actinomadura sp. J1-007]MWK39932.1 hypothetical protein [Actinomadura sp. J1-007]